MAIARPAHVPLEVMFETAASSRPFSFHPVNASGWPKILSGTCLVGVVPIMDGMGRYLNPPSRTCRYCTRVNNNPADELCRSCGAPLK